MRCPFCGSTENSVKDSRTTDDHTAIRRRRLCESCGSRFTTFEHIQLREINITKRDGSIDIFDRDKLRKSISKAIHKRSIPQEQIDRLVESISRRIETSGDLNVPSTLLGDMVIEALSNLDPVAYIRFASVYRDFSSVDDFINIMHKMKKTSDA